MQPRCFVRRPRTQIDSLYPDSRLNFRRMAFSHLDPMLPNGDQVQSGAAIALYLESHQRRVAVQLFASSAWEDIPTIVIQRSDADSALEWGGPRFL
ncbi:hypothetical protein Agabi119p4_6109 [Agaricus bisporus var. burnettii]|uniref:Uncharacterized protein n=1 Tax=Agaricus bisporus var. burnettii TaxID=192524 RepID=A0A8H7F152_AGABI|nr:hypothetical protein Agabi119p4_6109 [Agaricus bisporus var. burnettii]